MIVIYITCKNESEAKEIVRHLLEMRLIACANIFPIKSMYWFNDEIKSDKEVAILCKTRKKNFEEIKKEVEEKHSYDIPLIEFWAVDGVNENYFNWMTGELKK